MKNFLLMTTAAIAMSAAASTASLASSEYCGPSNGTWLGLDVITDKMTAQGYQVRKIEREDNCYEVYAISKTGQRVEIYLNPSNGEVVRIKNKS